METELPRHSLRNTLVHDNIGSGGDVWMGGGIMPLANDYLIIDLSNLISDAHNGIIPVLIKH